MTGKYSAFISYRHHPLDSAIAKDVQRMLEHFSIPRNLRQQTGKSKIAPIFRDKTELPITSDINDDILQALENSEFLIVICTTHTAESVWVTREIEQFLRTHSQDKILTVLAEGEPADVIPDILLWKTETVTDEAGIAREVRIPIEPLSCDFRGYTEGRQQKRTICREELPRLTAKLLGCSYDMLRQRQRQYQMQRLTAVFSAAFIFMAGLTAFFFWSNLQIQKNYENALRNQSVYLANESIKLSASGDRTTAMHLALAALPSEEMDRPLIPAAEYALSKATAAYTAPVAEKPVSVCSFEHATSLYNYFLNKEGTLMFVRDFNGVLTAWDTETQDIAYSISSYRYIFGSMLAAEDSVLILVTGSDEIHGHDSATGEMLWQYNTEDRDIESDEILLSRDGNYIYFQYKYRSSDFPTDYDSSQIPMAIAKLDARTGTLVECFDFYIPDGADYYSTLYDLCMSEDERYIAFSYLGDTDIPEEFYERRVGYFNLQEKTTYYVKTAYDIVNTLIFTAENHLVISAQPLSSSDAHDTNILRCLDLNSRHELWTKTFQSSLYTGDLIGINFTSEEESCNAILCAYDQYWNIYRTSDGKLLRSWNLNTDIVYTTVHENMVQGISSDGQLFFAPFELDYTREIKCFVNNIEDAFIAHVSSDKTYYILEQADSNHLLLYSSPLGDCSWQPAADSTPFPTIHMCYSTPYGLLFVDYDDTYYMLDTETKELKWQFSAVENLGDEVFTKADGTFLADRKKAWLEEVHGTLSLEESGFTQNMQYLVFRLTDSRFSDSIRHGKPIFVQLDLATGTVAAVELSQLQDTFDEIRVLNGEGFALYRSLYKESPVLLILNADGSLQKEIPLSNLPAGSYSDMLEFSKDNKFMLVQPEIRGYLFLVNTETTVATVLGDFADSVETVNWYEDYNLFSVVTKHNYYLYNTKGQLLLSLVLSSQRYLSSYCANEDLLLILCDDAYVYRYRISDQTLLGRFQTGITTEEYADSYWIKGKDGTLVLIHNSSACIINTESWTAQAMLTDCEYYLPEQDLFFAQALSPLHGTGPVGFFQHHSLEELMEMAQSQLGDSELSDVKKQEYGLLQYTENK